MTKRTVIIGVGGPVGSLFYLSVLHDVCPT